MLNALIHNEDAEGGNSDNVLLFKGFLIEIADRKNNFIFEIRWVSNR